MLFPNNLVYSDDIQKDIGGTTPKTFTQDTKIKVYDNEVHRLAIKYGQNETLARKIIQCESEIYGQKAKNQNKDSNGNVWSIDVGRWQINNYFHEKDALKLGYNIYNEWDNLEYGFIIMKSQGTNPWKASKFCWSK